MEARRRDAATPSQLRKKRADLVLTNLALSRPSRDPQIRAAAAAFNASSASPLKGDAAANRNPENAEAFSSRLAAATDPRGSKTSVPFRPKTRAAKGAPPAVSDEKKLLREVEASLVRTGLAGSAADAARRAAAAAAAVAGGMAGGLRSAGASPVAGARRRRAESLRGSPLAAAAERAAASSPDSSATSGSDRGASVTNESVSVFSHGIKTPTGEEATSRPSEPSERVTPKIDGEGNGKEKEKNTTASPGYKGVSQWMDAVVARAKAARAASGATGASSETLAAAAKAAGAASRFASSDDHDARPTIAEDAKPARSPTPTPASFEESPASASPAELRRALDDQRAAMRIIAGKYAAVKETHARDRKAREETAAALAKVLNREETFEEELRKATERCAEIEAGRRSARAALAEMASQNARLVSAFSAKKEEARTLRGEVDKARRLRASSSRAETEDATRAAREQAQTLREELKRKDAESANLRAELAECKLEIERLRDAVAAAARREARGEGDAEAAGTRAREESLAARVARKELEVERAEFAAERARWESERKRWAGEIASVRAAAATAAASAATAKSAGDFSASSKPGVPPSRSEKSNGTGGNPGGGNPNAPFKDPHKPGTSRSQPSSPTKRARGKALSPLRAANEASFSTARGASGASGAPRGARSAPSSPTRAASGSAPSQNRASSSSGARSPGPNASPRRRAEHHKVRGNNEFHAKRYAAALEQYTAGLNATFEDDAFRAILHANRAAAYQAMRRFCDAVMDCCVSHHLDPTYLRALQRRADAYLSMGDWPGAARDLATLAPSMGPECSAKLAEARRKSQKGTSIDHYAVLGVSTAATAAEIKQAYRKLALRHHPDKAPAAPPLRAAAEAIFKHVAQAYAVLSDATARKKYDAVARRAY